MTARRFLIALAMAALLPLSGGAAAAQGFDFASADNDAAIEIYADEGIEWSQDGKAVVARGNARAVRGRVSVSADSLTAYYRSRGDDQEIWKLEAAGGVVIATPTERATGRHAVYDVDGRRLVLTGNPVRLITPTDSVTAEEALEYHEAEKVAVARGNAVAVRGDRRIRAEVLRTRFVEDREGGLVMDAADAAGNVVLTTDRDVVTGDRGSYDAKSGTATLSGSVKISRGENQLNGGYAEVNLNTGKSRLLPAAPGRPGAKERVQGVFVPERRDATPGEGGR